MKADEAAKAVKAAKAREVRLRGKAERQGKQLTRSRRRDPDALDYGVWTLWDAKGKPEVESKDLDVIEHHLTGGEQ